jgi:hypothetical protein
MDNSKPPKSGFLSRILAGNFIDLQDLPVSLKAMTIVGYLAVFGLLFFTLLVEISADRLPLVLFTQVSEIDQVPFIVMAITGLAFILGWAYLLTGAAASKARIFLPVLILLGFQIFLVTGGNLLVLFLEVLFFLFVLVIYGLTFRTQFWGDLPGLHFFGWLGAISVLVFLSFGASPTNASVAIALSANFGILMLLTIIFWVVLGLSIIDLGIKIGLVFTRIARKYLPVSVLNALVVFVLVIHPAVAFLVFWLSRDGFLLLDVIFSILVIPTSLALWITHRWSVPTRSIFLSLSLAIPVVVLGLSMAFTGGDFTELLLRMTGLFPPILLFVGLTTYNLLSMGVTLTSVDGRILSRRSRVLLYFGTLILVVACMLFLSNARIVSTNQPSMNIQGLINSLFALSALVLGIPYLVWIVWKRREMLIGMDMDFTSSPRWTWLDRLPGSTWLALSLVLACLSACLLIGIIYGLI